MQTLYWNPAKTDSRISEMLKTLAEEYPIIPVDHDENLIFAPAENAEQLSVNRNGEIYTVRCGKLSFAGRGVGMALAGLECDENLHFDRFGLLYDCSRTGVPTVECCRKRLRRMALTGFNLFMLYTKDTYQLEGEPYFGYMRGAYSIEEIRAIDDYADSLNIEMCASIQALGHLEPILRWPEYVELRDTPEIIMADNDKSYVLLEKMIGFWNSALRSRRINLGMDETHGLGRGKYLDRNGYEPAFSIYNRHLGKMLDICKKFQLEPTIWADMYFRYSNEKHDYYDNSTRITDSIRDTIPQGVDLAYWDYDHEDPFTSFHHLEELKRVGTQMPVMVSGIWTWRRLWTDYRITGRMVTPVLDSCRKTGVREIHFALWGDDGGYCEFDSVFAAMVQTAALAFGKGEDENHQAALFRAVCNTEMAVQLKAGTLEPDLNVDGFRASAPAILWDDPLMGIAWHEYKVKDADFWCKAHDYYSKLRDELAMHRADCAAGDIGYAWAIADVLTQKIKFRLELLKAYHAKDTDSLKRLAENVVEKVCAAIAELAVIYRRQWVKQYKSYGMEIMQIRLAGLKERYRETARRINEYADGKSAGICELDLKPEVKGPMMPFYRLLATGGWFI